MISAAASMRQDSRSRKQSCQKKLEISRSPIREALRQLVSEGLAVEYPNRGVFVKTYTPKDIEDVFDLRILLESYAIMRSGKLSDLRKTP